MELSYCTNVHPAEDLDGVLEQLDAFAGPVRRAAGLDQLGVGLWLPADLAARLAGSAEDRARLRARLDLNGLELRMVAILREFGTERVLVNSAADWGNSDPLKTRKTGQAMLDAGFTEHDVDVVLWQNPVAFYGQSGRLHLDPVPGFVEREPLAPATFEGNSVLRGARV